MKQQNFDEYCQDVVSKAEEASRVDEMQQRAEYLRAFNFGRVVQKVNSSRRAAWQRAGWILVGLVIGVAFARALPPGPQPGVAQRMANRAGQFVRTVGRAALLRPWRISDLGT